MALGLQGQWYQNSCDSNFVALKARMLLSAGCVFRNFEDSRDLYVFVAHGFCLLFMFFSTLVAWPGSCCPSLSFFLLRETKPPFYRATMGSKSFLYPKPSGQSACGSLGWASHPDHLGWAKGQEVRVTCLFFCRYYELSWFP